MFTLLMHQTLNSLSDEQTEYLSDERLSFMCCRDPRLPDRVPDPKTI